MQAESASAVEEIDAIAATDRVDAVFVGPADPAADMRLAGQGDHPRALAAIERLIARTRAAERSRASSPSTPPPGRDTATRARR